MKSSLSEEVTVAIDKAAPLITFFGLSAKEQIKILPMLEEEKKYDFPDGDLKTHNALKVSTAIYYTYLNSIEMWLLITLDEFNTEKCNN